VGAIFLLRSTPVAGVFDPGLGADVHPLLGWPDSANAVELGLGLSPRLVASLCVVRTIALVAFAAGVRPRLAGIVAVAAAIRLTFWLLQPVMPLLLAAIVAFAVARLVGWYRRRW